MADDTTALPIDGSGEGKDIDEKKGGGGSGVDLGDLKKDVLTEIESRFPDLAESVSAKVKQDIIKSIVGDGKRDGPWIPKNYEEIVDKSVDKVREMLTEREKAEQEKSDKAQAEAKEVNEKWDKYWNEQVGDLEKDGLIPKLPDAFVKKMAEGRALDKEEQEHPAVRARSALYAKSKELKDSGYRDWFNLELVFHKHLLNKRDARNAPVSSRSSGGISPQSDNKIKFSEIRNKSMAELMRESVIPK